MPHRILIISQMPHNFIYNIYYATLFYIISQMPLALSVGHEYRYSNTIREYYSRIFESAKYPELFEYSGIRRILFE